MTKQLKAALKRQKKNTKREILQISGTLGIPINGNRTVEVPNRNAFVYVKLRDNQSEVIQAFNNRVAPSYGLPVIVERQSNRYVVVNVDTLRYQNNWNSFSSFLPRHGNTHSMDFENGGGGDIVWVHTRQFMPALIMPSGSDGGPNVLMTSYTLQNADGSWKYIGNTGTQNLTPYKSASGTQAVMALVYLDSISGNPYFMVGSGSYFPNTITGTSQILPYVPSITNPNHIPLAAVRLVSGTSTLSWDNIYDVRQFLHTMSTGTSGGGGSITVQDEGVSQGSASIFNFVGDNVSATVSGGTARIFVTGSSGGGVSNLTGTSIGQPNAVVMTSSTGTLVAQPWLQWSTAGSFANRPYLKFGADVAGQDGEAGAVGYRIFGSDYLEIVGAGTGTGSRIVRIFDSLFVDFINQGQYLKNTSFSSAWPFVDNTGLYVEPTNAPESTYITGSFSFLGLDQSNTSTRFSLPNLVDDSLSRSLTPSNGWIPIDDVWTRTGNHTFTVLGDKTASLRKGTKIRYKDGGSFEYGVVGSSSFSSPTTTVNLIPNSDYAMAAATITDKYISYIENPEGFPGFFNVTIGYTGFSANPTAAVSKWRATPTTINYVYIYSGLGTSNANTFTITGLPIAIATTTILYPVVAFGADNTANIKVPTISSPAPLRVDISGTTITFGINMDNTATWTTSGTKGVYALDITYPY